MRLGEFLRFMQQRHGDLSLDESLMVPFFGDDGKKALTFDEFKSFLRVLTCRLSLNSALLNIPVV